tara:strand:+ start:1867 stop:2685 length:819 start_codon:yes stop_codon:yes gene_type:complete
VIIFDIGSNTLNFTQACLSEYAQDTKIVVVEPNKECFESLYEENRDLLFGIEYKAVGAVAKKDQDFNVSVQDGISTMSEDFMARSRFFKGNRIILGSYLELLQEQSREKGYMGGVDPLIKKIKEGFGSLENWSVMQTKGTYSKTSVDVITLDMLVEKYGNPDLIKLDIEGYEHEALKGLTEKQSEISFEWSEETFDLTVKCINRLESLGYKEFGIIGFFEEGHPSQITLEEKGGDNYLRRPDEYYSAEVLIGAMKPYIKEGRRINWGMVWAK